VGDPVPAGSRVSYPPLPSTSIQPPARPGYFFLHSENDSKVYFGYRARTDLALLPVKDSPHAKLFHVSLAYRCGPRVSRLGRRVAISSGTEGWVANRTHALTIILRQILTTLTSATSKVPTGISDPLSSRDHFVSSPLPILLVDPLGCSEDGFMSLQNGCMTYAGVSQI
jgi:hypothetical protein